MALFIALLARPVVRALRLFFHEGLLIPYLIVFFSFNAFVQKPLQLLSMKCFLWFESKKKDPSSVDDRSFRKWALTDSNRRPSACKADALNQLS